MDRTRILFVFGQHGQSAGGRRKSASPKTKRFFRTAVHDFLKEEILENNGRVAVIHELVLEPVRKFSVKMDGSWRESISPRDVADAQQSASSDVRVVLDSFDRGRAAGLVRRDFNGWFGYIDEVLAMNRRVPGSVKNHFEPNCPQAVYECLKADWMEKQILKTVTRAVLMDRNAAIEEDNGALATEMEMMRLVRSSVLRRDLEVRSLCESIKRGGFWQSILVPRGLAHAGMVALFDAREFDITVKKEEVGKEVEDADDVIKLYSTSATREGMMQRAATELRKLKSMILDILKAQEFQKLKGKVSTG